MDKNLVPFWEKAYQEEDTVTFSNEPNKTIIEFEHLISTQPNDFFWLSLHHDATKWVVHDDLDLHNVQTEEHQVKPDPAIGLTHADAEKAVLFLC